MNFISSFQNDRMLKLHIILFAVLLFSSCGTSINYLGNSFDKTSHVDVYVEQGAIKKRYTVIGKGYEQYSIYTRNYIEKLQAKAIEKAKQKGADAILFQDYYLLQPGTAINTTTKTDTLLKGVLTISNTYAGPVISSGRNILFLKYE